MPTRKFDREFLKEELDLPFNAVYDEIIDTRRWSVDHVCVFEYEGKFYETHYSKGATECQDEGPWEYDDVVECTEVELKKVTVEKWVAVKDD